MNAMRLVRNRRVALATVAAVCVAFAAATAVAMTGGGVYIPQLGRSVPSEKAAAIEHSLPRTSPESKGRAPEPADARIGHLGSHPLGPRGSGSGFAARASPQQRLGGERWPLARLRVRRSGRGRRFDRSRCDPATECARRGSDTGHRRCGGRRRATRRPRPCSAFRSRLRRSEEISCSLTSTDALTSCTWPTTPSRRSRRKVPVPPGV